MGRQVEVVLQNMGGQKISRVYDAAELERKSIPQIFGDVLSSRWDGEQARVATKLRDIASSSGGYGLSVNIAPSNMPIELEPVRLGKPTGDYVVKRTDRPMDQILIAAVPRHVVGYVAR